MSEAKSPGPLALTMGCPVGIGPEIIVRLVAGNFSADSPPTVVIGDTGVLRRAADVLGQSIELVPWRPGEPIRPGTLAVFQVGRLDAATLCWGQPDAVTGRAMGRYIEEAVALVRQGQCSALVTCPIAKASLRLGGYAFPGHTEMLASLSGARQVRMMMAGDRLKVVLVTIHEPLHRVATLLSPQAVGDCIAMTAASLRRDFALATPRIAVAGLNPHGGEGGLFGDEEERVIIPAILACRELADISGPWPPDTVFFQAANGAFDAVVAMYHDQGLIPFKLLHFHDGVNVTLGLPFVRTSVDHGTAYDIAGRGIASSSSLGAAVRLARTLVANRERFRA